MADIYAVYTYICVCLCACRHTSTNPLPTPSLPQSIHPTHHPTHTQQTHTQTHTHAHPPTHIPPPPTTSTPIHTTPRCTHRLDGTGSMRTTRTEAAASWPGVLGPGEARPRAAAVVRRRAKRRRASRISPRRSKICGGRGVGVGGWVKVVVGICVGGMWGFGGGGVYVCVYVW